LLNELVGSTIAAPPKHKEIAMGTIILSAYVLIWPALVVVVLYFIVRAFFREWREARKNGKPLI
jgi:hypothetical protein